MAIKPLMKEMEAEGFAPNRPRQFCTALQKKDFLREKNLVLDRVEGPPSGDEHDGGVALQREARNEIGKPGAA